MTINIAQIAEAFLKCRDRIEETEKRHKEELANDKAALKKLAGYLLQALDTAGTQNAKIPGIGTAFKKKDVSVTVGDWEAHFAWMQANERWDFLEHRTNKTAVVAFMEEGKTVNAEGVEIPGAPPPGVNYSAIYNATVQRG